MKTFINPNWFFILMAFFVGVCAPAIQVLAQEAPDALVRRLSLEALETVKNDKELQTGDYRRVREVVESRLLPHVDFQRTTALAAGRFWRQATPEQQKRLAGEFHNLLIHTYSGALSQIKDQKLEFKPLRADPADTEVVVQSQVMQPGREPIMISYRLAKAADGWKIYDVNVLGAWLSEAYKSSFTAEIDKSGIDGLIRTLAEKNRRLAERPAQGKKGAGQGM